MDLQSQSHGAERSLVSALGSETIEEICKKHAAFWGGLGKDDLSIVPGNINAAGHGAPPAAAGRGMPWTDPLCLRFIGSFFLPERSGRLTRPASVYGSNRRHGGLVPSRRAQGKAFLIHRVGVDDPPAEEGRPERRGAFCGGRGILVVDDEVQIILILKEMLEMLGYRIFAAGCGQEAVATYAVKHDEIDLVILDMIMPGMGGGKAFVRLREINPNVRVIVTTGYAMHKDIQKVMAGGCDGFLPKPFKLSELSGEIRRILNRDP